MKDYGELHGGWFEGDPGRSPFNPEVFPYKPLKPLGSGSLSATPVDRSKLPHVEITLPDVLEDRAGGEPSKKSG